MTCPETTRTGNAATPRRRALALSPNAELIAVREPRGIRILCARGSAGPIDVSCDANDFTWVGQKLWVASEELLAVFEPSGSVIGEIAIPSDNLLPAPAIDGVVAGNLRVSWGDGELSTESLGDLDDEAIVAFLGGLRTLRASGSRLRISDPDREIARFHLLETGRILSATEVLEGAAVAVVSQVGCDQLIDILQLPNRRVNQIRIRDAREVVIAATAGVALAATHDDDVLAFDLRYGRQFARGKLPVSGCRIDIDDRAEHVAVATTTSGRRLSVYCVEFRDLFAAPELRAPAVEPAPTPTPPPIDAVEMPAAAPPRSIPDSPLLALTPARPRPRLRAVGDAPPFANALEHLDALVELAQARAALATGPDCDPGPIEALETRIADRVAATLALGDTLPLLDLATELELDQTSLDVIATVAAPAMCAKAARTYAALGGDADRSVCDRALVIEILGKKVRRALRRGGPLFSAGLLEESPSTSELFAHISVAEPLLDRLRGFIDARPHRGSQPLPDGAIDARPHRGSQPLPDGAIDALPGAVTRIVESSAPLEALAIPREPVIELVEELSRRGDFPVRVVVRGRSGLGGTSLLAALADRAGVGLAVIDASRLPSGDDLVAAMRRELCRARLWGALPCVAGLDERDRDADERWRAHLKECFRSFTGPIMFRVGADFQLPLEPGHIEVEIPELSETERLECWRRALERSGLEPNSSARGAEDLARQTRLGPAAIDEVVARVSARAAGDDTAGRLATVARQIIDSRITRIATRVDRRGSWDQLALDPDTLDAVRELVARARHRRTVFDRWGFDGAITSSRGLTALFSGAPGTGKTLVAGVIARELGLDLYRVDLARVVSKWVGETEKNLARLFDAATDSQAVILFDEADALFSRRTDVKSSNDRHANMETGYLLQRLDSFDGIAILTTNLSRSIDRAVARRISMRIDFPFPDDETRVALWKAHLPGDLPTAGDLELERLARAFPMTGGYVRNCALRAAFLAAADGAALTADHLERAIRLEYTQAGRLSASGRLE